MNIAEWISEAIKTDVGSGTFVVLVFGGGAYAVWKLSELTTKICFIDKINDSIDEIRKKLSYLSGEFKSLSEKNDRLFNSKSPIQINEKGEKIAEELSAKNIVLNHWEEIKIMIESKNLDNSYDIQEFCLDLVIKNTDVFAKDEIKTMKETAFNHGLGIYSIYRLVGLVIRDKYFEYKKIDISDIDKYDPKKS